MNGRESTTSATVGESPWMHRDAALAQGDFNRALPGFLGAAAPLSVAAVARELFALDVLACPRGGGRLRVLATVQDPVGARTILAPLGLALSPEPPGPAPPAPASIP